MARSLSSLSPPLPELKRISDLCNGARFKIALEILAVDFMARML